MVIVTLVLARSIWCLGGIVTLRTTTNHDFWRSIFEWPGTYIVGASDCWMKHRCIYYEISGTARIIIQMNVDILLLGANIIDMLASLLLLLLLLGRIGRQNPLMLTKILQSLVSEDVFSCGLLLLLSWHHNNYGLFRLLWILHIVFCDLIRIGLDDEFFGLHFC